MADIKKTLDQLLLENEELKLRLADKEALIDTFRENENNYSAVYNSMSEGLAIHELIYDKAGKAIDYIITDVNPAYEQIIGLKKKKTVGLKATEVYKVSTAPYLDIYTDVALSGEPQTFETFFPPMNKHFSVSVFSPGKGKFATIFQDITGRIQTEEAFQASLVKYKTLFDCLPLGVTVSDGQGKIIESNKLSEILLGITKEEQKHRKISGQEWKLIAPDGSPISPDNYASVRALKEGHVVENVVMGVIKPDNSINWINVSAVPIPLDGYGVLIIYSDITAQRLMDEKLREGEERFRNLVKNAPTAIYEIDFRTRKLTSVNDAMCKLSGYSKEELLTIDSLDLLEDESKKLFILRINDSLNGNIPSENVEYRVRAKDGRIIDVVLNMKFNFNEKGIPVGALAVGYDITERKHADEELRKAGEALKESESKLKSVLDATQESIYMFDRNGIIMMSNSVGLSRLKKNENGVIGHNFSEFMPPDTARKRQQILDKVFKTGQTIEFEDERSGRIFQHNFSPVLKDNKVLFVATYSTDITERKNAELQIIQSEDRFRTIAESLTVLVSITKISDSTITFINEPFEKLFGYKKGELVGSRMPDIYYYHDDNKFLVDALKVKGLVENVEVRVKKSDGTPFWIMTSIRKINYMNEPSYLTASINITETKKSQEELLRLNRTLDAQRKSSQAMMHSRNEQEYLNKICKIIIEDCGHIMVWVGYAQNDNRKSVKPVAHFGFDQEYIVQMNITWDDSVNGCGPTGMAIKTGKPSICRNMRTDPCFGPWREAAIARGYASSLVLPLKSEGKAFGAISIYSKDPDPFTESEIELLTELADDLAYGILFIRLTEYEKEATRAIKDNEMRLKELIATKDKFFNIIAHDLKNPFTSLLGASELLYDNITQMSGENVKKLALILNDSAKGGYSILQNLLDWSRSQTGQLKFNPENINLKAIIEENIDNLQLQVTNKEITLKSDLREDLFITADRNMINTVLRNLLSNAVKYTFKDGAIQISVKNNNGEITVTVKDTGVGISKEKADTLFKLENSLSLPGTAKEQGTGLGLKLCKEFTEKMGGKIWVESEVGKGSKFNFTILTNGTKV